MKRNEEKELLQSFFLILLSFYHIPGAWVKISATMVGLQQQQQQQQQKTLAKTP